MKKPKIKFEYGPSGNCPVQAEGTINGHRFYFRSRGGSWSMRITKKKVDPLYDKSAWCYREEYRGSVWHYPDKLKGYNHLAQFSAGWATEEECKSFIRQAAYRYVNKIKSGT